MNSFTYGQCESWIAGVARVDEYLDWIEDRIDYAGESIVQPLEPYENKVPPAAACNTSHNTQNTWGLWTMILVFAARFRREIIN